MIFKRIRKERDFYEAERARRRLPALRESEAHVFEVALELSVLALTCVDAYPFAPPSVHIDVDGARVAYVTLLAALQHEPLTHCMCRLINPDLFDGARWPPTDGCPCCSSVVCSLRWNTAVHMHDIVAEAQYWCTYRSLQRCIHATTFSRLPVELVEHMVVVACA